MVELSLLPLILLAPAVLIILCVKGMTQLLQSSISFWLLAVPLLLFAILPFASAQGNDDSSFTMQDVTYLATAGLAVCVGLVGGGGKLKKKRPASSKSILVSSGLSEDDELKAVLSISRREGNNVQLDNSIYCAEGDLMVVMSTNELNDKATGLFTTAVSNGQIERRQFTNSQQSNSCASVSTYTAARHVVDNTRLTSCSEHVGTSMGFSIYNEICNSQLLSCGTFISLECNSQFIPPVVIGIEMESIEAQNLFDRHSRRSLLEKLNQGGYLVGIGKIAYFLL